MTEVMTPNLSRSNRYRGIAGALRTLASKLKQPESRLELQQLADDYDRLAQFTQSVSVDPVSVERCAKDGSERRSVWIILTDNSLDN